ncbi:SNF1-related protein kinase catalytic subunit alpha KIN11 [Porphyridium purpureum]|uniref:SNF1-related protein kinase catalytic subunit alpha KIN11 n=1 Tax=Porphyridium purpureum TaxID=35688 RepID=A0A5J4YML7_PORPP|nr:SNF1-related protein kinase catalytic subunit alpha KIN11 [Porphyridium purpureum]|eukprot:POR5599..scf295_9
MRCGAAALNPTASRCTVRAYIYYRSRCVDAGRASAVARAPGHSRKASGIQRGAALAFLLPRVIASTTGCLYLDATEARDGMTDVAGRRPPVHFRPREIGIDYEDADGAAPKAGSGLADLFVTQVGPYKVGQTIGTGSIGKVLLAQHVISKELVAIKFIRKSLLDADESLARKVTRETVIMKLFDHPHVLRLYDVYENDAYLMLVLEYAQNGELFDYVAEYGYLDERLAAKYFHQLISGVQCYQRRMVAHRDLKPENLLLDENMDIKIADFGMAAMCSSGVLLKSACGSPHYAAPEVISGLGYNGLLSDLWSCGVVLYVLVCGGLPFDDDYVSNMMRKISVAEFVIPEELSVEVKDLISRLLVVDAEQRLSIPEILSHPWMKQVEPVRYQDSYGDLCLEPVSDPVASWVSHLVDLGLDTEEVIRSKLANPGNDEIQRDYYQLARHNVLRRAKRAGLTGEQLSVALREFKDCPKMGSGPLE